MPQTIEECDIIGQNWTWRDYFRCVPEADESGDDYYYENDESGTNEIVELTEFDESDAELEKLHDRMQSGNINRKVSLKKLTRQSSVMDTQRSLDGTMKITYWF